jgi:hypothetical protein
MPDRQISAVSRVLEIEELKAQILKEAPRSVSLVSRAWAET